MIDGAHVILYSHDADATRATLARVLRTQSVDAGGGWLLFALPPAEIAVHPAEEGGRSELYLMTDDVQAEGIEISRPISDQGWGLLTAITLPGGIELGLYQPRHPTATQSAEPNPSAADADEPPTRRVGGGNNRQNAQGCPPA